MTVSEFIRVYRQIYNCIKCNWPRHDLRSLENKKVKQSAKLLKVHIQKHAFGKQCKDKNNEAFIPETASGNSSEWEESDKITSQKKKKTQTRRGRTQARAGGGGGESSEIRVTLHHSGTCSAYKLRERPEVCHRVISPLSVSRRFGLDSVPAAQGDAALKTLPAMAEACFGKNV